MKIDDLKKPEPAGKPVSSFNSGDCVRLVSDGADMLEDCVYIVARVDGTNLLAINLHNGRHRDRGRFVLVPHAEVVIG